MTHMICSHMNNTDYLILEPNIHFLILNRLIWKTHNRAAARFVNAAQNGEPKPTAS